MGYRKRIEILMGFCVMLFIGFIYAWSIFREPLSSYFNTWTVSQLTLPFTISMICFCVGGLISGKKLEAWGYKKISFVASIIIFIGFLGVSALPCNSPKAAFYLLIFFYGICCGTGVGIEFNALMGTVVGKHSKKIGTISGIMLTGFGMGGVLLGVVADRMIEKIGLFTLFRVFAIVILIVLCASCLIIKDLNKNENVLAEISGSEIDFTPKRMTKTTQFWIYMVWFILLDSSCLLIINLAVPVALTLGVSTDIGLSVLIFNGMGRIIMGLILDRIGSKKTMRLNTALVFLAGSFFLLCSFSSYYVLSILGFMLCGLAYGGDPAIASTVTKTTFGQRYYPANFSIINLCMIPASVLGPMTSSFILERSNGNYTYIFLMTMILSVAAMTVLCKR